MEKRIFDSAVEIIKGHLGSSAKCSLHGGKGKRETSQSRDAAYDELGIDIHVEHDNQIVLVQVKCGTKENFEAWGKPRNSFTLGDPNDILWPRKCHFPKFYHLFLSGYELEPGKLSPYVLINWPFFIRLAIRENYWEKKDDEGNYLTPPLLHLEQTIYKRKFAWMCQNDIPKECILDAKLI